MVSADSFFKTIYCSMLRGGNESPPKVLSLESAIEVFLHEVSQLT